MKSYTDLNQSKKLAEILPLESADMEYLLEHWIDEKTGRHKEEYYEIPVVKVDDDCPLQPITHPCWSLSALLDVLPDEVGDNHYLTLDNEGKEYCCCYEDNNGNSFRHCFSGNPVDACVAMIENLHELKML